MKKLLLPIIIAVLAGIGGGSGFAYMRASKSFVADSTQRADSLKAHPAAAKDSTKEETPTGEAHEPAAADSAPKSEPLAPTPADSIRALEASRATLHAPSKSVPETKSAPAKLAVPAKGAPPAPATSAVADAVRGARNEALNTALPEQRLAKIFSAMAAKDAAKVMDQMPDADVRTIIGMMSDRNAAAILALFKVERAAAITKSSVKAPTTP